MISQFRISTCHINMFTLSFTYENMSSLDVITQDCNLRAAFMRSLKYL